MFKKIHSNRDPKDTLYSELRKEFGTYFNVTETRARSFLEDHARLVFRLMIGIMLISIILSFTVFRHRDSLVSTNVAKPQSRLTRPTQPAVITDGFSRIMQVSSSLREMLALKKQVDSITAKKFLTRQDSLTLEKDLDRLQQINKPLKTQSNGH